VSDSFRLSIEWSPDSEQAVEPRDERRRIDFPSPSEIRNGLILFRN